MSCRPLFFVLATDAVRPRLALKIKCINDVRVKILLDPIDVASMTWSRLETDVTIEQ
jgi:hypothetical protein